MIISLGISPIYFVIASGCIDVIANVLLQRSKSFKYVRWGLGAIMLVWLAFGLLGQAMAVMDLAVAYALWGVIGVTGTALCGRFLFGQRLQPIGWFGIGLIVVAVVVLNLP